MRKALIVDDEILSVRMMNRIIDWQKYGIEICASAEDGVEALEQFEQYQPDIILTDIRMPRMDGLEFIRRVREKSPETEFILISAYADFSYVKKAMAMGCANYILKPVDEAELEEAVKELTGRIDRKEKQKERQVEILEENQRMKLKRQLALFMRTGSGPAYIGRLIETGQIPAGFSEYRLAGIMIEENSINDYVEHTSRLAAGMEALESRLESYLNSMRPGMVLDYEEGCWTILISAEDGRPPVEWANKLHEYILQEFNLNVHICFTLTYGDIYSLPKAFARLGNLGRFSFYVGETPVLGYGYNCEENEFDQLDILDRTKVIGQAIEKHDTREAKRILAEVLEQSVHLNPAFLHYVYEFCYNVVCDIREQFTREESLEKMNHPIMKVSYQDISAISTVGELESFMAEVLGCLSGKSGAGSPVYGRMVLEGIEYLEKHFDSNISLDSLCASLAVSKNYFCYLFKRETGESIWSYLTQIRLKRSKELLLTTDYKSYEIAYKVGYDNPSYFSRLFKKSTGLTPNEYRAGQAEKNVELQEGKSYEH